MSTYYNHETGETREIDDALYAQWTAAGNPKAAQWVLRPEPPAHNPDLSRVTFANGEWIVEPIPFSEIQAQIGGAVQAMIDAACTGGVPYFRDIFSARGYVGDPNPAYHARAVALRDWSSSVWTALDVIQADVMAGNRPLPTIAELMGELPGAP